MAVRAALRAGTLLTTKADRVRLAIQQLPELFTVAEVERACPGVKRPTIKLAMKRLREAGEITCVRPGKYALGKKMPSS